MDSLKTSYVGSTSEASEHLERIFKNVCKGEERGVNCFFLFLNRFSQNFFCVGSTSEVSKH